jgi:DNA-binding CsgD family transcriptional regulator
LLDGRLDEAASISPSYLFARPVLIGQRRFSLVGVLMALRVLAYLGRLDERILTDHELSPTRTGTIFRILALTLLGRCDEVPPLRDRFGDVGSDRDESGTHVLAILLEASTRCRDEATAGALLARLTPLADRIQGDLMVAHGRVLGEAARMLGKPEQARVLYLRALAVCAKLSFRPETAIIQFDLAELLASDFSNQRAEAIAQLSLAIPAFEEMKMHSYLDRALRLGARVGRVERVSSASMTATDALTSREREVAALLGAGMSNREIADALTVSEGTAEVHVKHILAKLGLRSRAQAAVWAVEHGLVRRTS